MTTTGQTTREVGDEFVLGKSAKFISMFVDCHQECLTLDLFVGLRISSKVEWKLSCLNCIFLTKGEVVKR